MNRIVTKFTVVLLALTFIVGQLHAQFTTTFAKNVTPGQSNGLYYSLPQTVLRLDFIIEEAQLMKGPLSDYASNYFEMEDVVDYETTEYQLLDVKMTPLASPDPNALFFVSITTVRGGGKMQFDVLPNGIIRSVGLGNDTETEEVLVPTPIQQKPQCCHEENANGEDFVGLLSAGKTNAQLAKEVADKIAEIRKAKFYLISGDVEMASNPETFKTMYKNLDVMEKEYTSLLLGKRVTRQVVKSVYVIPNKEVPTQTVAKFSETEGLTLGTGGSGSMITVQTLSLNTTATINAPSQSAVESVSYENKVFYRVPETAQVRITCGNTILLEDRVLVDQLGAMLMAPITNTKLVFDTETGQIINMRTR
ncbi:MAG: DUF4831 family protein [Bacteroidales bacterium]|nr:DUF4831 family protein [Bacteroidales bacterium]